MMVTLSLKIAFVIALAVLVTMMMRRAPAAVRHATWLATIAGVLVLPLLSSSVPRWRVPMLSARTEAVQTLSVSGLPMNDAEAKSTRPPDGVSVASSDRLAQHSDRLPIGKPALAYLFGVAGVVSWILLGRFALSRIASRAVRLHGEWDVLLNAERAIAGVSDEVRLLCSDAVNTPVTYGTKRPVILLPSEACDWSEEFRVVVLRHEMTHIQRRDASAQFVSGLACALYWFHPGVWLAAWRLRIEREHACDDRVLLLGTDAGDYASYLLDLARSARRTPSPAFGAMGMAKSQLEQRVMSILDDGKPRIEERSSIRVPALVAAMLVFVVVSAFTPVQQTPPKRGSAASPPQLVAPRKIVKVDSTAKKTPPALIPSPRSRNPRLNAPTVVSTTGISSIMPIVMKSVMLTITVTANAEGGQHWFEIAGKGASLDIESTGNIRQKDGRILVHTPARIVMRGEGEFGYLISSLESNVPKLNFSIGGVGSSFARGGTLRVERKHDDRVSMSAESGWGGPTNGPMHMYEISEMPTECVPKVRDPATSVWDRGTECWAYWRGRVLPNGTLEHQGGDRIVVYGGFTVMRAQVPVPDSLLPPPRVIRKD